MVAVVVVVAAGLADRLLLLVGLVVYSNFYICRAKFAIVLQIDSALIAAGGRESWEMAKANTSSNSRKCFGVILVAMFFSFMAVLYTLSNSYTPPGRLDMQVGNLQLLLAQTTARTAVLEEQVSELSAKMGGSVITSTTSHGSSAIFKQGAQPRDPAVSGADPVHTHIKPAMAESDMLVLVKSKSFDGTQHLDLPIKPLPLQKDFTLGVWIKTDKQGKQPILVVSPKRWWSPGRAFGVFDSGVIFFDIHNVVTLQGSWVVNRGVWHHVAISFSAASEKFTFYVDGMVDEEVTHIGASKLTQV